MRPAPFRRKTPWRAIITPDALFIVLYAFIALTYLIIPIYSAETTTSLLIGRRLPPAIWPSTLLEGPIDNIATDGSDGAVFVAIDGDIHKFNDKLTLLKSTNITPKANIYQASAHQNPITSQIVNKILQVIKFNPNRLFACWQNPQLALICVLHRLSDLAARPFHWLYLNSDRNLTFKTNFNEHLQVLHATSDDSTSQLFISTSRPLATEDELSHVIDFHNISGSPNYMSALSRVQVKKNSDKLTLTAVLPYRTHLDNFHLLYDYVYMFNHESYTHFILNDIRKPKPLSEGDAIQSVRLARVCHSDTELTSYTEISLTCNNQADIYAKTAYFDASNSLYVVFETLAHHETSKKLNQVKSLICSYSMKLIQDLFRKAISDCYNGFVSSTLLHKLHPHSKETPICHSSSARDWCISALNPYIDGYSNHQSATEDSYIELSGLKEINFLHTTKQGNGTTANVYFIGTESGLLTKLGDEGELFYTIDLHNNRVKNYQASGEKYSSAFAGETASSTAQKARYAVEGRAIFATSSRTLHKLPIDGCQFYTTCHSCLVIRDPLGCIWCGDFCSSKDECDVNKVPNTTCAPRILNFTPSSGPTTGQSRLSIYGDSFGSSKGFLKVEVGEQECFVDREATTDDKIECLLKPVAQPTNATIHIIAEDNSGAVSVTGNTSSSKPFEYKDISIYGLEPSYGPREGGADVKVYGVNLDAGSNRTILLGDSECQVTNVMNELIECKTRPATKSTSELDDVPLKVIVDGILQNITSQPSVGPLLATRFQFRVDDQVSTESALEHSPAHQDGGLFGLGNLFLITVLIVTLIVFVIYLARFEGFTHLKTKMMPNTFTENGDLETAKVSFRNPQSHKFINERPGDSLNGLIKLNDSIMSSDYFGNKTEQLEQDRPLMNNLLDEEMIAILAQEKILIDKNRLTLGHVLGSGQYGRVYKGFLKHLEATGEHKEVAVKTLQNRCQWDDSVDARAFIEEGLMMKDFVHDNVLGLLGLTFDSAGQPMVITPFMRYGDLRSYISDEASSPTVKELIEFGIQVAQGMAYLSNLKFVHRDLAARNCMLDENLVVKVADFGLSRDIYERDYYSSDNKKAKLPVKWMAIESLEKSVYSTKTDVWSYGVLLWELMTRGVVPYPDVDNFDLFSYLKEGRRMLRPRYCPMSLYKIMQACWSDNPANRPSFDELVVSVSNVITQLLDAKDDGGQQRVSRDETYCDVVTR